ncbi:MAG TPA: hypothetical protein VLY63_18875 [Anaerolineae bacterium]|nr:hypothetical protein [Anaerolineae bacterium]
MDILHWFDTLLRVTAALFFTLLPGTVFWLLVLGLYLMIQRLVPGGTHRV